MRVIEVSLFSGAGMFSYGFQRVNPQHGLAIKQITGKTTARGALSRGEGGAQTAPTCCSGTDGAEQGRGLSFVNMGLLAHGTAARLARHRWLAEPGIGRVATGIPDRAAKLKALGNGLVWQIPAAFYASLLEQYE